MKPSDRILALYAERLRVGKGDSDTARWAALLDYLDEREELVHPIARVNQRPAESIGDALYEADKKVGRHAWSPPEFARLQLAERSQQARISQLEGMVFDMQNAAIDLSKKLEQRDAVVELTRKVFGYIDFDCPANDYEVQPIWHALKAALDALDQPNQAPAPAVCACCCNRPATRVCNLRQVTWQSLCDECLDRNYPEGTYGRGDYFAPDGCEIKPAPERAQCTCPDDQPGMQRVAPGCPRHDQRGGDVG